MGNQLDRFFGDGDKDCQVDWAMNRALEHLKKADIAREELQLEKWKHGRTEERLNARVRELNARITALESELAHLRHHAKGGAQ